MSNFATFAIYKEGTLKTLDCSPEQLNQPGFIVAGHLDGIFTLDQLTVLSSIPLLYATPESAFEFKGAHLWFERRSIGITELIRRLGSSQALELLLTEATIDASRAHRVNFINDLLSRVEFDRQIEKLSKLSLSAIELAVELARRSTRMGKAQAEALERYVFALRFSHPDQQEGMRAFIEKRPAEFNKQ